jgi:hypothetical protein
LSDSTPVFGKRGVRPTTREPAAARPPPPEPSAAYLEIAAAARKALGEREPSEALAEASPVTPVARDDDDMRAYVGPNWRAYRALWGKMKDAPEVTVRRSFFAAVFSSLWLLYRKQYALGAAILAAQAAMMQADSAWSSIFDLVVATLLGQFGMSIVLLRGARRIARVRESGVTPGIAAILVGGAGGVDWVAALSGAALLAGVGLARFSGMLHGAENDPQDIQSLLRVLSPD